MRFFVSICVAFLILGPDLYIAQNKRKLDSLYTILSKSPTDSIKKNTHVAIVNMLMKGDTIAGYKELRLFLPKLNEKGNSDLNYRCIEKLAYICTKNFMKQKAQLLYQIGLARARLDKNNGQVARFYYDLADFFQHEDLSKTSIAYFDSSLLFVPKKDIHFLAEVHTQKGRSHYDVGDYKKAMDDYILAQKIYESNKVRDESYGQLLHFIGSVFKRQKLKKKALEYYEQQMALAKELNNEHMEAEALYLSAGMYGDLGDEPKEELYEQKALDLYRKQGNRKQVALLLGNISSSYSKRGDYKTAIDYCNQALEIYTELKEPQKQCFILSALGDYYYEMGEYKRSIDYFNRAMDLASKIETKQLLIKIDILQGLAYANAGLGNYKEAFKTYREHIKLRDSLSNMDNRKYLSELEKQYDTEKKEKEIALLNKDKEMQSVQLSKQATQKNFLIIGCILVLIIAGVSLAAFINKRKTSKLLSKQVLEINYQNSVIKEKNKDITDSILYAKRLQEAVFPLTQRLNEFFAESFVLFRPKDIVSGDFYWFDKLKDHTILIVGDSTGHGVPGAFMSILGHNLLNQIILEERVLRPADILTLLDKRVTNALNRKGSTEEYNDGMDIGICVINKKEKKLYYAGANRPLIIRRDDKLFDLKQNKFAIGGVRSVTFKEFTQHEIDYHEHDVLYMFSDGYYDQFGGPNGKKFKFKQMHELLLAHSAKPLQEQMSVLNTAFENWKGTLEQVDDVCVVGVKI
jgi:serine phosphatase RsbU (regulator of sigma subunit)